MSVAENLRSVLEHIRAAEKKAGRAEGSVKLIAVSKTFAPERILEAVQAGQREFGENRVQELVEKQAVLAAHLIPPSGSRGEIHWHMIGSLQTNKVKQVVGKAALIHSLDRPELAEEIHRQAEKRNISFVECLVQINSSGEVSKQGLAPGEAEGFVPQLEGRRIKVRGLMTIGPLEGGPERARECFRRTRQLRDRLAKKFPQHGWDVLSMGMSGDYEIAIEEGATLVRVGSAIFGARTK